MLRAEIRSTLELATPIVVVQLGLMTLGVTDTLMVGRISPEALAAVALGNLYVWTVTIFAMGVLMALDPLVAQAVGAGDFPAVSRGMQRGLVLALLLSVPVSLALVPGDWILTALGQPPGVVRTASAFARVAIPGVLPFLGFVVLRQSLQAMGRTAPIVRAILWANLANIVLNWLLIFGHLGLPALGAVGSSLATTLCRWLMALLLLVGAWRELEPQLVPFRREAREPGPLLRMLRLGAPIGAQYLLEIGAFASVALLMGSIGIHEMAGHQIAINLASLTFMVPMGIAGAAAVRVGQAVGRADALGVRRAARVSLGIGAAFMAGMGVLLVAAPVLLARAYTGDATVVGIAALLIPIAGFFQVFDGLQVVASGVLRGLGDTRGPMLIHIVGFWLVGLPLSLLLAFPLGTGPEGLWWGLVGGLAAVAVLLLGRIVIRLRGGVSRIEVESRAAAGTQG